MRNRLILPALLFSFLANVPSATAVEVEPLLKTLKSVDVDGAGHRAAIAVWPKLAKADAAQLPEILAGIDGANPLAANWIRTAVDTIAERELQQGGKLPAEQLERFVFDTRHAPRGRRLAFEWLARVDRTAPGRIIPKMLNDPSVEMRRDAVAWLTEKADALAEDGREAEALTSYRRALSSARDPDQIKGLAETLRKAGQPVDLPRHFGFLMGWKVIGPFDNTDEKGFDIVYPPEKELDLAASYDGKHGTVTWTEWTTEDDYGNVDINRILEEEKGVVAYATCEFVAKEQQPVEFRMTTHNATKLWLNGRLIGEFNVYHAGSDLDQYKAAATLKPGRNVILLKVCQNEQTQSWARDWHFALRVCGPDGTAILSADRGQ